MNVRELLQFVIEADSRQAIRAFDDVEKASTKHLGAAETGIQKWSAGLTKAGAIALGFAGVAAVGLGKAAQSANQLAINTQRIEGQFDSAAPKVMEFVREANKIGLSDRMASQYVASVGELAVGLGIASDSAAELSTQAVEVVTQLAMIKGLDVDAALQTINATLIGEFDSMQKLVPEINAAAIAHQALAETGKESTKELTAAEKATAALHIILQSGNETIAKSGSAMDTLAGKTAVAKANLDDAVTAIGAGVLPVASSAIGIVGDLAGAFAKLPPSIQETTGKVAALGTVIVGGLGVVSFAVGQFLKMKTALDNLSTTMPRTAGALGGLAKAAGIAVAVSALGAAIGSLDDDAKLTGAEMELLTARLENFGKSASQSTQDLDRVFGRSVKDIADDVKTLYDTLDDPSTTQSITEGFESIASSALTLGTMGNDIEKTKTRIDDLDKSLAQLAGTNPEAAKRSFNALRNELAAQGVTTEQLEGRFDDYQAAVSRTIPDVEDLTGAITDAQAKTVEFDDALKAGDDTVSLWSSGLEAAKEGADAFGESLGGASSAIANAATMGEAFDKFGESVGKLPPKIDTAKLALGGYDDEQEDAIATLADATSANADYLSSLIESGATLPEVAGNVDALRQKYVEQMEAAGLTTEQINEYLRVLGLTPEQVETAIRLAGDAEARFKLELLQGQIDKLDEGAQAEITQLIIAGDWQGAMEVVTRESQLYANRHPITIPYQYRIGGGIPPELRGIPTGPRTATAGASTRTGTPSTGMGSQMIVVNLPSGATGTEVVNALRRYQRANGPLDRGWTPT